MILNKQPVRTLDVNRLCKTVNGMVVYITGFSSRIFLVFIENGILIKYILQHFTLLVIQRDSFPRLAVRPV